MTRVSGSQTQQAQYSRQPKEVEPPKNGQARSYANQSPDQQRAESVARKPRAQVKSLGNNIDVYA